MNESLRITEVFYSLQGESTTVGLPTVFVRLTGCPLRCQYCDSAYAFRGGEKRDISELVDQVKSYSANYVTVTGGEPLAQPGCHQLLNSLCSEGLHVSLETSGALDISDVHKDVMKVMDIKTPDSLEVDKNLWSNIEHLTPADQVKFVICSQKDYEWSKDIIKKYNLDERCEVLMSPSWGQFEPQALADAILHDKLKVRFQMQLHKMIWGDVPGK